MADSKTLAQLQLTVASEKPFVATGWWQGLPVRYEETYVSHQKGNSVMTVLFVQAPASLPLALRAIHHTTDAPFGIPIALSSDSDFDGRYRCFAGSPQAAAVLQNPQFRQLVTAGRRRGRPGEVLTLDSTNGQVRMTIASWDHPVEIVSGALAAARMLAV
ncbi:MAG: hypothetical protein KIT84_41740 [Labilithrix sp.]|nr:hypothetical protein [Labilithrix sp.]MCW5817596.1 hypothetical protein [Labilithrix sp.]